MTAAFDFDQFLRSALREDGPQDVPETMIEAALTQARDVRQRRPAIRALDRLAWPITPGARRVAIGTRRAAAVLVVALLIVAAAVALAGVARLLEPREDVFGVFERTGELPPTTLGNRYINAAATLPDGRVLVVGMYDISDDPADSWAYLYDPAARIWTETGPVPGYLRSGTATTLQDGRVLFLGGWRTDSEGRTVVPGAGDLYDPRTGTFESTQGALATPRLSHTATLLPDGRVLVTGGMGADFNAAQPEMDSAEIFDPRTGLFTPTGSMSEPREMHAATALPDGRVLITGGMTSRETYATAAAEIFDPVTGSFTPVGDMSVARSRHAAVTLADGRVLVVGGGAQAVDPLDFEPLATAEIFDPASGTFTTTGSLATERLEPAALRLADGRVLVAGGSNDFGAPRTAELFDPATGGFAAAGASVGPHGDAWTGVLPDGSVLLLGQIDDPATTGVPEVWKPLDGGVPASTDTNAAGPGFSAVDASSDVLRAGHTATRLDDGRVLLVGGADAARPRGRTLATAEILDPSTGRSEKVGDMATRRSGHVAVLLADGRVLVAGGEPEDCPPPTGACMWPAPSAEIFDPSTRAFTSIPADLGPAQINSRGGAPAAMLLDDGGVLYVGTSIAAGASDWNARHGAVIDPSTGESEATDPLPCTARASLARLPDGRVFVQCGGRTRGAYLYDPSTGSVTAIAGAAAWDGAVAIADGQVLVVRARGDAAIFDSRSMTYADTGSMTGHDDPDPNGDYGDPYPRRLVLLDDGRVLVTGGQSSDLTWPPLATAELYDPSTGTFQSIGPMLEPRFRHSATLLEDGRVLLVGGVRRTPDRTDAAPVAAEIFDANAVP